MVFEHADMLSVTIYSKICVQYNQHQPSNESGTEMAKYGLLFYVVCCACIDKTKHYTPPLGSTMTTSPKRRDFQRTYTYLYHSVYMHL